MLIVNADDLGMTPGANRAIFDGYDNGCITHASIMANCDYTKEALLGIKQRPQFSLGMHLNITYGKPLIHNPLYCNEKGIFNLSYKTLLLKKDEKFIHAIEKEWEAQIQYILQSSQKKLTHIDSHRHIHLIPHLYPIVIKLSKKYNIPRVRLIEENIFTSLLLTKRFNFIHNGGIIKYLLLYFFTIINKRYHNLYQGFKFYSILYTGVINKDILSELSHSNTNYEIMVHPSYPKLDTDIIFYDNDEKKYRISTDRYKELQTVLSMKIKHD